MAPVAYGLNIKGAVSAVSGVMVVGYSSVPAVNAPQLPHRRELAASDRVLRTACLGRPAGAA